MKLPGFGPETADVVALMVYGRPRFIFDAYARRLLRQAGYEVGRDYEQTRRAHEAAVADSGLDVGQLKDFHGLIITAGQTCSCSRRMADLRTCDRCGAHEPVTVQVLQATGRRHT